ncbi:MAG TPA: hypothetical protein VF627_05980, partial [Abditibacterium sp.]
MKRFSLFAAKLALSAAVLSSTGLVLAQEAPDGWKTQSRANGATTFTPPDLRAGETYNVTTYASVPLGGKRLETYLREFAGPVGTQPGQLAAALKVNPPNPQAVTGIGAYMGPGGKSRGVMFIGFALDGVSVTVTRTLFSDENLVQRYLEGQKTLMSATLKGVPSQGANAGSSATRNAPANFPKDITIGGELVSGVYAGTQYKSGMFGSRSTLGLRVYIYANGEYRICDQNDEYFDLGGPVVGKFKYNRACGSLDIKEFFALSNDNFRPGKTYCYYGRNSEGKPVIFGRSSVGALTSEGYTILIWEGPPTARKSRGEEDAPARALEAKKKAAQDKLNRIQTRVAPGQGVPASEVAAIVHHFDSQLHQTLVSPGGSYIIPNFGGLATYGYNAPIHGMRHNLTSDTYLLLRDGTIHRGLETAPDQFDIRASRRKEPENWGLWKQEGGKIQMSFAGKPYEDVPGRRVLPNRAPTRLSGRYTFEGRGTSFTSTGRFQRSALDPKRDPSAKYTLTKS